MPNFFSTRSTGSNEAYPSAPSDSPNKGGASDAGDSGSASRPKIPGRPVRQKYLSGQQAEAEKEEPASETAAQEDKKSAAAAVEPTKGPQTVKVSSDLVSMPAAPPAATSAGESSAAAAGEGAGITGRPVRKDRDPAAASSVAGGASRRPTVRVHHSPSPPPAAATPTASLSPRVVVPPPAGQAQQHRPQSTSIQPPSPRIVRHTPAPPPPGTPRTPPAKPTPVAGGFTPSRATMFLTREFSSLRISKPTARVPAGAAGTPATEQKRAEPEKPDSARSGETATPAEAKSAPTTSDVAAGVGSPATVVAPMTEAKFVAGQPEIEQSAPAPDVASERAPETTATPAPSAVEEPSIPSLVLPAAAPAAPLATAPEGPVAASAPTAEATAGDVSPTPAPAAAADAPRETLPEASAPVTPPASAAPAEPAPAREETATAADTRRPDPTPASYPATAPSVLAQVTFSFEVIALELTAGFKVDAVEARPSSETVSVLLGAESKSLITLAAAISFSVESCRTTDDGKFQALTLTPLTEVVAPINPSLGLKVGATTLPGADSTRRGTAPIALAASSPQPVQVHASCRIVGMDFNGRFEIERLHLELETQSVYVQLDPASAHLSGNPPPAFTIAFAQVSADASPVAQLRLTPGTA